VDQGYDCSERLEPDDRHRYRDERHRRQVEERLTGTLQFSGPVSAQENFLGATTH